MRVKATRNSSLIREVLSDQRLHDAASEDGTTPLSEFEPNVDDIIWLALIDDNDTVRGFMVVEEVSKVQVRVHIAIRSEFWGDKDNVQLGKLAFERIWELGAKKIIATIPTTDKQVLRYAQRVGMKREGINRQSFLRKGELLDQYYLGLVAD